MRLLRHGQLEVETDLLLGVEEVLLPLGALRAAAAQSGGDGQDAHGSIEWKPQARGASAITSPAHRGFEAALFEASPGQRRGGVSDEPAAADAHRDARVGAARGATPDRAGVSAAAQGAQGASGAPAARAAPVREPTPTVAPVGVARPQALADRVAIPVGGTKAERLAELEAVHARTCPCCAANAGQARLVFGEGSPDAEIAFVGEAPGEADERAGRPFMGEVGAKLDQMIRAMGFAREAVYIANIVKCRPPGDRTPSAGEIAACGPYLLAQLAIVAPRAIVTFGGPASKTLLASELGITRLRGEFGSLRLRSSEGDGFIEVPLMPTTHPAQLLRTYTEEARAQVWSDLRQVLARIGRTAPGSR